MLLFIIASISHLPICHPTFLLSSLPIFPMKCPLTLAVYYIRPADRSYIGVAIGSALARFISSLCRIEIIREIEREWLDTYRILRIDTADRSVGYNWPTLYNFTATDTFVIGLFLFDFFRQCVILIAYFRKAMT